VEQRTSTPLIVRVYFARIARCFCLANIHSNSQIGTRFGNGVVMSTGHGNVVSGRAREEPRGDVFLMWGEGSEQGGGVQQLFD
jgi:hypothetical protein